LVTHAHGCPSHCVCTTVVSVSTATTLFQVELAQPSLLESLCLEVVEPWARSSHHGTTELSGASPPPCRPFETCVHACLCVRAWRMFACPQQLLLAATMLLGLLAYESTPSMMGSLLKTSTARAQQHNTTTTNARILVTRRLHPAAHAQKRCRVSGSCVRCLAQRTVRPTIAQSSACVGVRLVCMGGFQCFINPSTCTPSAVFGVGAGFVVACC
jgi:hypothetical protein